MKRGSDLHSGQSMLSGQYSTRAFTRISSLSPRFNLSLDFISWSYVVTRRVIESLSQRLLPLTLNSHTLSDLQLTDLEARI